MRTYLILKDKACRWNHDREIQAILAELVSNGNAPKIGKYSRDGASTLLSHSFDKEKILQKRLPYERLDQLTVDLLLGVR